MLKCPDIFVFSLLVFPIQNINIQEQIIFLNTVGIIIKFIFFGSKSDGFFKTSYIIALVALMNSFNGKEGMKFDNLVCCSKN